jgi:hypothetical protein
VRRSAGVDAEEDADDEAKESGDRAKQGNLVGDAGWSLLAAVGYDDDQERNHGGEDRASDDVTSESEPIPLEVVDFRHDVPSRNLLFYVTFDAFAFYFLLSVKE